MTVHARFTMSDLSRAVRAMRKAGCVIAGAKINPATGEIVVLTKEGAPANDEANPLEQHLNG